MAKRRIEVDIVANDQASSVFQNVRTSASGMASTLMGALGSTVGAVDSLDKALRTYNASMYRFNRVVGSVARTAGDSIYNFTKDAINNFSQLEQQHAKTMGAMATEYGKTAEAQRKFLDDSEKLKQQALTLGTVGPTGKGSLNSVMDISYAQTALVKAGMSADDLLTSNAIESILKFAGGNDLDIDTATQFAVNLGTIFDKPVEQWGEMLDMVTKAADISVIDVEDIMDSLTYTGGIASGLGRELSEVLGVISVMGQAGLRGRVAGTGLQAFFTRILSAGELSDTAIGNAPTEYVGQMYNAFVAESVNADGTFKEMDEIASLLDTAMSELTDQEQAWFAKKLFGLYQMKAAYAISGSVDGDENLITDFIDQIEDQSAGTNDIKYELMLASQYGKLEALQNAWDGIKTDFGDKLSPVTTAVADELFAFLSNNGNYEIDWTNLRDALSESGDLIAEKYGEQLGQVVEDIGNFGIDAGLITEALLPHAGGILSGFVKLMNGDISGALDEFEKGLSDTNDNIEDLPPELQDTATAARNVITAFTALAGINLGTQILQVITSAFNTFIGKPISAITSKINSTTASVSSTSSVINATSVAVNTGTATGVNIGKVPLMNVTASVVNVFGGGGLNPGNPGGGLPGTGTPLLPGGGGGGLLPWAAGGAAIGAGGAAAIGSGGGIAGLLPGATAAAGAGAAAGKVVTLYNIGGTYMTAGQAMKALGGVAFKGLGLIGATGLALTMTGSSVQEDIVFNRNLDNGIKQGLTGDQLRQYVMDNQYGVSDHMADASQAEKSAAERNYASSMFDAMLERSGYFGSQEGLTEVLNKLVEHYESGEDFDESFFRDMFSYTASNGTYIPGSQELATQVLNTIFGGEFKPGWIFGGSYNDAKMNDFIKEQIEEGSLNDLTSLPSVLSQYDTVTTEAESALSKANSTIDEVNEAIKRIENPNINVNVTTNVDKSGNVTTDVDISNVSRNIARRASQYGQTTMIN